MLALSNKERVTRGKRSARQQLVHSFSSLEIEVTTKRRKRLASQRNMNPILIYNIGRSIRDLLAPNLPPDQLLHENHGSCQTGGSAGPVAALETPVLLSPFLNAENLALRQVRLLTDILCPRMTRSFDVMDEHESILFHADTHLNSINQKAMFFNVRVTDPANNVLILAEKRFQKMTVACPNGGQYQTIGTVVCKSFFMRPKWSVLDDEGHPMFRVRGPFFHNPLCKEVVYPVRSRDDVFQVGAVTALYDGCCLSQYWNRHDRYTLTIPRDLDVRMKAVLLCMALLIDVSCFA